LRREHRHDRRPSRIGIDRRRIDGADVLGRLDGVLWFELVRLGGIIVRGGEQQRVRLVDVGR
jgi:hypothetical protein